MTTLERQLLLRLYLHPETLTRNRNPATFEDPVARLVLRRARHLRSLRGAVLVPDAVVSVSADRGRVRLRIERPSVSLVRSAWLSSEEYEVWCADPAVSTRLSSPSGEASAQAAQTGG